MANALQAGDSRGSEVRRISGAVPLILRQENRSSDELRDAPSSIFSPRIRSDEYGDVVLSLIERSGIGLAILDPGLRIRSVNSAFSAQCGRHHDDLCDRSFAEFLHPSVRQHVLHQLLRLAQGHQAQVVSRSLAVWFHDTAVSGKVTAYPVEDADGKRSMILVQFTPEEPADDRQALVGSWWKLTPLKAKVLEGVAAGDPTIRLAARLFLSRQGIEYHVSILLRLFKVPNRTALAAKAYSMGMFSIGCWPPKVLPDYIRPERETSARSRGEAGTELG
ncbi:PAS domain-containing protein [Streptomyces sp. NPDC059063]|uniref:PAS domain-containing protein n=1 Tax=unclassified Streptomyces TaxID=2593676 RepID=UPI00367D2659